MSRHRVSGAFAAVLCACGAPPPPPPPVPEPPARSVEPAPLVSPATPASQVVQLENGLSVVAVEARGADAQLQVGFLIGSLFVAPGLAELAVTSLVHGADASRGRPSLEQAVARLGGIVQVEVGTLTTWVGLRVPAARWQQAEAALLAALTAPALPRSQLERIRDDLVRERCDTIEASPHAAMGRALLLAEPDTSAYVTALLDRDPSEVALFQARYFRPERSMLALQVPGKPEEIAKSLGNRDRGGLSAWTGAPLTVPTPRLLERQFTPGFYWAARPTETCRAAILIFLPDLQRADAADILLVHACLTLDGTGGRLEQMQREGGIGHTRWRSEFVRSADTVALLLTADVTPAEAVKAWETLQNARNSLRVRPPSVSEINLARRRAALTAGLGLLDNLAKLRIQTNLQLRGAPADALDRRFAQLEKPGAFDAAAAIAEYLKLPASLIVAGGEVPAGARDVVPFHRLPPELAPVQEADAERAAAAAAPWLDRAMEAVGGKGLLRRFLGADAEASHHTDRAPQADDRVVWRTDGTMSRTRSLLGTKVETRLEANTGTEQSGDDKQTLTAAEVALLRREMARHPIALLAAACRGDLAFHAVAQRRVGDRDFMVLEATGTRFDRLRMHVDTASHLIRVVEVWETTPDGTTVRLQDAWSDYRSVSGMRTPFRRVTTQDDGENIVETVWSSWQPVLSAP